MRLKLLIIALGLVSSFAGGWGVRGWFEDSQALSEYERALRATEDAYTGAIRELYAELDAEAEKSIALERANASLRQSVSALRKEITDATFTVPPAECPAHSVASPEFVRLYDSAAKAGDAGPDSARVSPRDD